jgi:hypothetical protein
MSTATPTAPAPASPHGGGRRPGVLRRYRTALVLLSFLVLAVVVVLAFGRDQSGTGVPYDPRGAGPDGAQAVARVLDAEGVDVEVARGADAFDRADVDAGTTVVVTSTEQLGESTLERLFDRTADSTVVLVDPPPYLLQQLDAPTSTGADTDGPIPAGCDDPRFDGLEIEVDDAGGFNAPGCFDDTLVTLGGDDGATVLLGAGELLTNDQVLRADNAAVALRLLGEDDRLVWYVASYDDLAGDEGVDFWSLAPDGLRPALVLAALALLALMLWRGRRLGRLATEPLPVSVKAIETTRSRGRLYRKGGDRAHAGQALRGAARDRCRTRLRLGAATDEPTLLREVARRTGRPEEEVGALLGSLARPPSSDRDLVALAGALQALEEEVRRS